MNTFVKKKIVQNKTDKNEALKIITYSVQDKMIIQLINCFICNYEFKI